MNTPRHQVVCPCCKGAKMIKQIIPFDDFEEVQTVRCIYCQEKGYVIAEVEDERG